MGQAEELYAHSIKGQPDRRGWEPLRHHLAEVGHDAGEFARVFDAQPWGQASGQLHDIGKASAAFQAMLRGEAPSPDHSTAGAIEAARLYGADDLGRLLAFGIAGHHAGLADGTGDDGPTSLDRRLAKTDLPDYSAWRDEVGDLPDPSMLDLPFVNDREDGFDVAFFTRMIFSCLVDADSLAAARFESGEIEPRLVWTLDDAHLARLRAHMAKFDGKSGEVNRLRAGILNHVRSKAAMPPGLFTLTVPTGGGKTLASLDFALDHAQRHDKRRVVYVIPFTSIIEQTADLFRAALGDRGGDVLEHHSSFDWEAARDIARADDETRRGLAQLERAAENWNAPIVVTTAVQFFESLFAARRGRCRRLHNLADSVIILDEAQKLPVPLLLPCMVALDELSRHYGASVILCTATQPALAKQDGALPKLNGKQIGLDIPAERELAPDPDALYRTLKRVQVEWRRDKIDDEALADVFARQERMLCIVNSRAHARELFERLRARELPGARHLTTLMCVAHRREVLAKVRADLDDGLPVRLVSTSLIEAGVDVDFPEVWRAAAGLDSIAHGGVDRNRGDIITDCNGHGRPPHGGVDRNFGAMCRRLCRETSPPTRGRGSKPRAVDPPGPKP